MSETQPNTEYKLEHQYLMHSQNAHPNTAENSIGRISTFPESTGYSKPTRKKNTMIHEPEIELILIL